MEARTNRLSAAMFTATRVTSGSSRCRLMSVNASMGRWTDAAQNCGDPNAGQARASTTPPVGSRCSAGPNRKMSIRPSQNTGSEYRM